MKNKSYLIFEQNNSLYGVEASIVQEIFFLPELTPIAESPLDIVGVINLRGEILPVMDLNLRFGYPPQDYSLTDSLIVLEWQEFRVGIVVNQVHEVQAISTESIKSQLSYGREAETNTRYFIEGITQIESGIIMLINAENLIQYSQKRQERERTEWEFLYDNGERNNKISLLPHSAETNLPSPEGKRFLEFRTFCPKASPQEKAIFRERADNLKQRNDSQDFVTNKLPLAVIALNGEYFGLNLEVVREFTDIRRVTPIPCTPSHLIGNMNLRGEILTLIDIRSVLNMPLTTVNSLSKAIVVQIAELVAGIVVDEVLDVMYLNPLEMTPVPTAVHSGNDEYLRGTVPYREKMMGILDIYKMLTKGVLTVDEEV